MNEAIIWDESEYFLNNKISRKQKIDFLTDEYVTFINLYKPLMVDYNDDTLFFKIKTLNSIIIDSVGISGLKLVKRNAYKWLKGGNVEKD